jgi:two-component system response regulator HydG
VSAGAARAARILVVEDNDALRRAIVRALGAHIAVVEACEDGARAVERLGDPGVEPYDVVVTDLRLPGADGLSVLRAATERHRSTAVLLMTAHGNVDSAVRAMQEGAFDFLQKPFELEALEVRVERALEHVELVGEVASLREARAQHAGLGIIGESSELQDALSLARRVAPTRSTVLVTGETGTGKEMVASLVHALSPRTAEPFVKVNCAALPETLLESELFGHERGAFTGADRRRIGRFEQADGGTLFLDEVGEMSPATQAKLLRVLQDHEFHRLGGSEVLRTDVRIVAATNVELEEAVARGHFREDLYFRLNVIRVHLPPLRERAHDTLLLADHFLSGFASELGRPGLFLDPEAERSIVGHTWPGNARELRNVIERAVLLADGSRIGPEHLGLSAAGTAGRGSWRPQLPPTGLSLADIEHAVVMEVLERAGFVQKEAAGLLSVSRRKLNYMIQRMGITHPSWRRNREAS